MGAARRSAGVGTDRRGKPLTLRLSAPWLLPINAAPIHHGAVLIDDRGRIVAVGVEAAVPRPEGADVQHFEYAVLLPGLVNTHTHLELTGLGENGEETSFRTWLRSVIDLRGARTPEQLYNAAITGIKNNWASGVTTICDTGSSGAVIAALHHSQASGIAHHEVFGPHPEQFDSVMPEYIRSLDQLAHHATGRVTLGLSPHAPYSVSGRLYRATADLARAHGAPIAIHIAESPAESALLNDFSGEFAEMFRERGIPRPSETPITPMQWVAHHGVLGERTLCIHAVQVDAPDIELMVQSHSAVAHCPRSNRHHHGTDAPLRNLIDSGLRIGLGTDSELSVAPPNLLAEARAAALLAGWSDTQSLRALTLGGAEALGLDGECGTLAPGKWADIVAIRVGVTVNPEQAVMHGEPDAILATWLGGRKVH